MVKRLQANGVSIIFISHAIEEALQISDRITILRDGEHVATDATPSFDRGRIVRSMVGRTLSEELYGKAGQRRIRPAGRKVLSVQNLSMGTLVRNTTFSVFAGQITGVFGLIGSGRTETAKVVSGVLKRDFFHGGQVRLEGSPVRYRVPRPAVRDGIIYVTEDRKLEGFFETMSVAENIYLGAVAGGQNQARVVKVADMAKLAEEWTQALNIRVMNADARVIELSGGNQQKVVVAKALAQRPKLIIFDEPTRGVDVGAIAEIHQLINKLADQDLAVMVISSYLPEILHLSDRILVSRQGRIVEEFTARGSRRGNNHVRGGPLMPRGAAAPEDDEGDARCRGDRGYRGAGGPVLRRADPGPDAARSAARDGASASRPARAHDDSGGRICGVVDNHLPSGSPGKDRQGGEPLPQPCGRAEGGTVAFLSPTVDGMTEALLGAQISGVASSINYLLNAEVIADLLAAEKATVLVISPGEVDAAIWQKAQSVIERTPSLRQVVVLGKAASGGRAIAFAGGRERTGATRWNSTPDHPGIPSAPFSIRVAPRGAPSSCA